MLFQLKSARWGQLFGENQERADHENPEVTDVTLAHRLARALTGSSEPQRTKTF